MKKLKNLFGDKRRESTAGDVNKPHLDFDEQFRRASASGAILKQAQLPDVYRESPPPMSKKKVRF